MVTVRRSDYRALKVFERLFGLAGGWFAAATSSGSRTVDSGGARLRTWDRLSDRRQLLVEFLFVTRLGVVSLEKGAQGGPLDDTQSTVLALQHRVWPQMHQLVAERAQNAKVGKGLAAAEHHVQLGQPLALDAEHVQVNDELVQRSALAHMRGHGSARNERQLSSPNGPGLALFLALASGPSVTELALDRQNGHAERAGLAVLFGKPI